MPKRIPEQELRRILAAVPVDRSALTAHQLVTRLDNPPPVRTLQYRLRHLVDAGRLTRLGEGRWARYGLPAPSELALAPATDAAGATGIDGHDGSAHAMLSPRAASLRRYLQEHPTPRRSGTRRRRLLDTYRPNASAYLRRGEREQLLRLGRAGPGDRSRGVLVRDLGPRLHEDFTWHTARLADSRYTALEVRRLLRFGRPAEARHSADTQLVLNHHHALQFLLEPPAPIGIDRLTLCNLHAILAHNLLGDEAAAGRVRAVDERFRHDGLPSPGLVPGVPMAAPFERLLATANAIADPWEQALYLLVQMIHLAPFEGLNAQVALLAANLSLLHHDRLPVVPFEVPADLFADAVRGVVERSRIDLMKDLFLWACERTAERYAGAVAMERGCDPFRLQHGQALRELVAELIERRVPAHGVDAYVQAWGQAHLSSVEARERLRALVDAELAGLDDTNFARYPVNLQTFRAWRAVWTGV